MTSCRNPECYIVMNIARIPRWNKSTFVCTNWCHMCSSHIIAVTIGFEEILVEVEESDQQATLNVRISFPTHLEIIFSLFANTMDGSASMDDALQ